MGGTSPVVPFGFKITIWLGHGVVSSFLKMGRFVLRQVCWFPLCRMERAKSSPLYLFRAQHAFTGLFQLRRLRRPIVRGNNGAAVPKRSGMRTSPQYTGTVCVYAFSTAMASNRRSLAILPLCAPAIPVRRPPAFLPWMHKLRVGAVHSFSAKSRPFGQRFPRHRRHRAVFHFGVQAAAVGADDASKFPLHVSASSITM